MTATQAGQPAQDPEDGHDASRSADDADGTVTFDPGYAGADRADEASLTAGSEVTGSGAAERIAALRARLVTPMPGDRLWGWIGPLLVTLFAGFLRFSRLSVPNAIIFDETYYAKDAWSILRHGVEWNWIANPTNNANYVNGLVAGGHYSASLFQSCTGTSCGEYVVQPEVGKLLIAVGEWLWGLSSLGWRFAPALFGTLAILVMCRVARRMTRSTLLGLHGRAAAVARRPRVRAQPDGDPGHLPDVLRPGRVRRAWSWTGTCPGRGWPRPWCSARPTRRAPTSGSGSGGSWPG